MAFVGGFLPSGAVGLWGILAPLGALVFKGARSGVRWFAAFVAVFLVSGIVGEVAGGQSALPSWFSSAMIALNVTVGGAVVFLLLAQFVRQREEALAALQVEQDRAETLLLNILPRSIAERLKTDSSHDRGPVRRGLHPVRRRRRLHAAVGQPAAGRGGQSPGPPVHALRPPG